MLTDTKSAFQSVEAATGEFLNGEFKVATTEDVNHAFAQAKKAFAVFGNSSGEQRALFLEKIADNIEALGEALIQRASAETGLVPARIVGERGRTLGQLRSFATLVRTGEWVEASIDQAEPNRSPIPKPDVRKMLHPLGTVVVFGASNFPLAYSTAGGDTASALAAGNCVIVKGHPAHAGTSEMVAKAISDAVKEVGLPAGVFTHLQDNGFALGKALVEHPEAKAVGFTGSIAGGRALYDMAGKRTEPIPVFAEMGSVNPIVLLPNALDKRAVQIASDIAKSITTSVGQFCTNPGLMFAMNVPALVQFEKELDSQMKEINPATMLHSGISKSFHAKRKELLASKGVELISQSKAEGTALQGIPTVATTTASNFIANPALHEEIFGPLSLLVKCSTKEELLACINCLSGQLTSTLIAEENELNEFSAHVSAMKEIAGRLVFNGVPTGVEVCPSMNHGGPYPSTTDSRFTAVGIDAIKRFVRPVCYQNWPQTLLPEALKDANPLGIVRRVNGKNINSIL